VRRHFLDDLKEKVIHDQDQGRIASGEDPFYDDDVSYAFPDQPYFDSRFPDIYCNFLTIHQANQVVNQGVPNTKYGEDWRCYNRLLAKSNTPDSVLDEEWSSKMEADSDALVILTEWDSFKSIDWNKTSKAMRKPAWIFDSRNIVNKDDVVRSGLHLWSAGVG